jgi:hypothetical protein
MESRYLLVLGDQRDLFALKTPDQALFGGEAPVRLEF